MAGALADRDAGCSRHETVYRSLYVQGRDGLHRDLVKTLRATERCGLPACVINIALRPIVSVLAPDRPANASCPNSWSATPW